MTKQYLEAIKSRRSIYSLTDEKVISNEKVTEIVEQLLKYTPTAFNSQSARVIILFDEASDKFWNIAKEQLRKVVPEESFASTEEKIDSFSSGFGTILYYEDASVVKGLQDGFPLYADNFPVWSNQSSGMLQYAVWVALEIEGVGASLQHYNEIVEEAIKEVYDVPETWILKAQMPFGGIGEKPASKDFQPTESRLKIFED